MNVIVPVNLEVLRVSPSPPDSPALSINVKTALYDFSKAGNSPLAGSAGMVAADNFSSAEESLHDKPGLHLHWSIPKAYTHGAQDNSSGELFFPTLPNRWLVLRFFKSLQQDSDCIKDAANFSPSVQAWILESDAHVAPLTTGFENSTNIPWMSDTENLTDISYRTAGQKIKLNGNWTEPGSSGNSGVGYLDNQFQAPMAYGETFTAYYRNCGNIFGMYDDLSDLFVSSNCLEKNCSFSVSYAVTGWVSPNSADTCNEILTAAVTDFNKMDIATRPAFTDYIQQVFEQQLHWNLSDYSVFTPENVLQTRGVFSGISSGTTWNIAQPRACFYPDAIPDASKVLAAIGNSNAEALSAYLNYADQNNPTSDPGEVRTNTEWLLNALQSGQLQNLGNGELGAGQLNEYLHSKTFGSQPGGFVWTIRHKILLGSKPASQHDTAVTLPLPLAKILSQLNSCQNAYDKRVNEISTRQKKLFLDWSYHINAIENNVINGTGSIDNDLSGDYLTEGLMHLFVAMMRAGAADNIAGPGVTVPYSYKPAPFAILPPATLDVNLPSYNFNTGTNGNAAAIIDQLLDVFYSLEGSMPNSIDALRQSLQMALQELAGATSGGSDSHSYLGQAISTLQNSQSIALHLNDAFAKVTDKTNGIQAIQSEINNDVISLTRIADPTAGLFSQLKIDNPQRVPVVKGVTYTGKMSLDSFPNTGTWNATDGFPGMKSLIDQCTGQGKNIYHIADIQAAGLYLAIAYFWKISGQTSNVSTAYYIQMAQQEVENAIRDAGTAGAALQNAIAMLAVNNGTVQQVGQAISRISGSIIPGLLKNLQSKTPDLSAAISDIQTMLDTQSSGSLPLNTDGLQTACSSYDWLQFVSSIEQTWLVLLSRLPDAQQVAILSYYLDNQVNSLYTLRTVPSDNFWQPREPVLLLSEKGGTSRLIKSINRNGASVVLPCRLITEIVTTSPETNFPALISGLANNLKTGVDGLSTIIQQLAGEACLLSPEIETLISADVLKNAATGNENLHNNKLNQVVLNPASAGLNGMLPYYIAWNWSDGSDPFLPLFIFWNAEYVYSQQLDFDSGQLSPDYLKGQFGLDQYQVENQLLSASVQFQKNESKPNFFSIYGVISLTGAATANLCDQIRSYCIQNFNYDPSKTPDSTDPDTLQEEQRFFNAYNAYKTLNVLSQSLSGFNAAMVQCVQELQLPLNLPAIWTSGSHDLSTADFWASQMLYNQSKGWPEQWASECINLNFSGRQTDAVYFNPLRAGFLKIQELTLVDVFGRYAPIILNGGIDNVGQQPIVSEALQLQVQNPLPDHPVYLPPRILQPSRLLFKWISADSPDIMQHFTEWNPHPAASPVCGWLLPNHLDHSLMLYKGDGTPLGSLRNIDSGLHWFTIPGESYPVGTANRQLMLQDITSKQANPLLQSFLETFAYPASGAGISENFNQFLGVLDTAQQFIITPSMQQDQSLAVLIGQPLVLVQASLRVELMGVPYTSLDAKTYMPWDSPGTQFQMDQNGFIPYNYDNFSTGSLYNLSIPVKIGALEYQKNEQVTPYFDDGLIGFFLGNDFSVFYTPVQLQNNTQQIISTWMAGTNPTTLQPNGTALTITMIIDPRASVHATTGILPVQNLKIPDEHYSRALSSLLITFLTAPVLRTNAPIRIPAPAETGYQWTWQQVGATGDEPLQPSQLNTDAVFPPSPQFIVDGWMKLKKSK